MGNADASNQSSLPEGLSFISPKNKLQEFIWQVHGDLQFAQYHVSIYPKVKVSVGKVGKGLTFKELNYDNRLLQLIVVALVSHFEDFMKTICRQALLQRHNLFGQFNPSVSWKQVPKSGSVDALWEAFAEQVLSSLESGKLRTYAQVFKKLGVVLPSRRSRDGKALEELIRRRNVIVHNRSKPDKQYLEIVPSARDYVSGSLPIDINYIEEKCNLLITTSGDIVQQLVNKGVLDSSELEGLEEPT